MYRRGLGALALAAALLIAAPTIALAATPAPSASPSQQQTGSLTVPIVGNNGTNAVATITSFRVVNGVLTAVGTITGNVTTLVGGIPVTTTVTNAPFTAPITNLQSGAACDVLTLDVGAIHLDLLGLIVDLSPIHLNISAQPGSGNLLGNLLCAVTRILDNNGLGGAVSGIANLLNHILAAL